MVAADFTTLATSVTAIIALGVAGGLTVWAAMQTPKVGIKVFERFMK